MIQGPRMRESQDDELWEEWIELSERMEREKPELLIRILDSLGRKVGKKNVAVVDAFYEGVFTKEGRNYTPMVAAQMCRRYLRFSPAMLPFLIKQAQRVKRRVYMWKVRVPRTGRRKIWKEVS